MCEREKRKKETERERRMRDCHEEPLCTLTEPLFTRRFQKIGTTYRSEQQWCNLSHLCFVSLSCEGRGRDSYRKEQNKQSETNPLFYFRQLHFIRNFTIWKSHLNFFEKIDEICKFDNCVFDRFKFKDKSAKNIIIAQTNQSFFFLIM